jgi:imidazole glycerol-phosphate synthase subunit HisF
MVEQRLMPVLLVSKGKLVKTKGFRNPQYIGDPVNAAKIFNKKELDELVLLDISPDRHRLGPDFNLIRNVADECFMPVSYGGGIATLQQIEAILKTGIEKVVLNSCLYTNRKILPEAASVFGSQSIIASVDVLRTGEGSYRVMHFSGKMTNPESLEQYLAMMQEEGAGEILLQDVSREGFWSGFDLRLIESVVSCTSVPVIATGGAGTTAHISEALSTTGVSGIGLGSMAVYQKEGMGVLIGFPEKSEVFGYTLQTVEL